jgi:hypothetical protein
MLRDIDGIREELCEGVTLIRLVMANGDFLCSFYNLKL